MLSQKTKRAHQDVYVYFCKCPGYPNMLWIQLFATRLK